MTLHLAGQGHCLTFTKHLYKNLADSVHTPKAAGQRRQDQLPKSHATLQIRAAGQPAEVQTEMSLVIVSKTNTPSFSLCVQQ